MQLFGEFWFFAWLGVLSIPAIILGIKERPINIYGFAVTLLFILFAMRGNRSALIYLLFFCIFETLIVRIYIWARRRMGRNKWIYYIFLSLSIVPLLLNKFDTGMSEDVHIFGFLGISYMTFKVAQIIIETYDGIIKEISITEMLYLMLFFPTITSGPIDRSRRFHEDMVRFISKNEYLDMLGDGIYCLIRGLVYKMVFGTGLYAVIQWFGMGRDPMSVIIYFYAYGTYLFFDFAGYSLMAIGAGKIFGVNIPTNFNAPFKSRDIKEFWDRWHITLSHWLRDYLFSRITMKMIASGRTKNKLVIATTAFMINMCVMGVWHGIESYYIAYGLYHGILLSACEIVQKKSKFYRKHRKERWFILAETIITFHLVMLGFMIFSGRLNILLF